MAIVLLAVMAVNVNIRMYNFDDVHCTFLYHHFCTFLEYHLHHGKCPSYKQYKKDMATLKADSLLKSEPYIYIRSNVNKIRRKMGKPDYAV